MARKDSEFIKLVGGKGGVLWPSHHERLLLKFTLNTFGEMLSHFLLTGLGKKEVGQRWYFVITFTSDEGTVQKRHLRVITYEPLDGESFLPRGRDPMILLALLQLLLHGHREAKPALLYQQEDILNLLGWEETVEVRHEIDEAVKRYSILMYMWEINKDELAHRGLSYYRARERMILEYDTTDKGTGEAGQMRRVANHIIFDEYFIDGLLRHSLFDVVWDRVRAIKLVAAPPQKQTTS